MGIKGLTQLIGDCAPGAIKENEIKNYFGKIQHAYACYFSNYSFFLFQAGKLLLMLL